MMQRKGTADSGQRTVQKSRVRIGSFRALSTVRCPLSPVPFFRLLLSTSSSCCRCRLRGRVSTGGSWRAAHVSGR